MTTHEIISAKETPLGIQLKIKWPNAQCPTVESYTVETYSEFAAKALGYQRPDPQPVDPAWMVEVAREAGAQTVDGTRPETAKRYRGGEHDKMSVVTAVRIALRLALSRGHVVLTPVMPGDREMLKDAREDAAQMYRDRSMLVMAEEVISGTRDDGIGVSSALQARRNVYASLGAVARPAVSSGPVVPEVDLREVLTKAWGAGWNSTRAALCQLHYDADKVKSLYEEMRRDDVSAILEDLKIGEA